MKQLQAKRTYLSGDARRKAIVAAASDIVESCGWEKLSMSAVAKAGGTSRQLLYQHFPSLDDLMLDTATLIFQRTYMETRKVIAGRSEDDILAVMAQAQLVSLELPPGRARALAEIVTSRYAPDHPLHAFSQRVRHLITNLWYPAIMERLGLDEKNAKAMAWMLVMAFWGGQRLMAEGELNKAEVVSNLNWLIDTLLAGVGDGGSNNK